MGEELQKVERGSVEHRKLMESFYDEGFGSCLLKDGDFAELVIDAWKFFDGERYDLIAYVVMPSHVHLMVKSYVQWPLHKIVHSWKSFTSHEIIKSMKGRRNHSLMSSLLADGTSTLPGIWQRQYWDRFIRDERHYKQAIFYIHNNPVKARLCEQAEDWKWSSCYSIEE